MNQTNYRLTLAQGFLNEAQQDTSLKRWRSAVDNAQLGFDVHVQTDYGDETLGRTPWELFDEDDAHQAVSMAVEAATLAQAIVAEMKPVTNSVDDGME